MRSHGRLLLGLVSSALLVTTPAVAQKADAPPPPVLPTIPPETPAPARPARRVVPTRAPSHGPRRPPWWARKKLADSPLVAGLPIASFPGFARLEDGKSRIFVEVGSKVEILERKEPGRLVYKLRNAAVTQHTNALPLVTSFFSTPVDRVQLVQDGPDVNVVIELREATNATSQVVETPRGIVLWVDFPRSVNFKVDDPTTIDIDAPNPNAAHRGVTSQRIGVLQGPGGIDLAPPTSAAGAPAK